MNEQSLVAGTTTDDAGPRGGWSRPRIPKPIWRFRTPLKSFALVQTLKAQITPRLALVLRSLPNPQESALEQPGDGDAVTHFTGLVLADDETPAFAHVDLLLAQGVMVDAIFLDLLAPVARRLGEQWETDVTDFAAVTLGVSRLQRIMRRLGESFSGEMPHCQGGGSALLTIVAGEQHSFGLSMVAEFFRRAGWNLCTGPFASQQELTWLVQNHWFDVVGFSISSDQRLDQLKQAIRDIRRDSRNRHVGVILGGPMMVAHPGLVEAMGADMASIDAATAPQQARELIVQMNGRA